MLAPMATQFNASATSLEFSGERLLNYMIRPGEGVGAAAVIGRSGLVQFAQPAPGWEVRNMIEMGGFLYVAANGYLWKVTSSAEVSTVGPIEDGVTRMAQNGTQVAVVVNGKYYVSDGDNVSRVPVTALAGGVVDVVFIDGYFVLAGSTGGRSDALTVSGQYDGARFRADDFAFAEREPDPIVALVREGSDLWALGSRSYQVFYNSGNADFPFEPNGSADGTHGCVSVQSAFASNDAVCWVRNDGGVMLATGYVPQQIATPAVQETMKASEVQAAGAVTDRGQEVLYFRLKGRPSLCFDLVSGLWHERSTNAAHDPWRATVATRWNGQEYVGTDNGKVCTLSDGAYDDAGDVIAAQATMQPVDSGGNYFVVSRFYANVRGGIGGLGRDPLVTLQTSRDGREWSDGKPKALGGKGDYYKRADWRALGAFQRFQARLTITDPVPRDIAGVAMEVSG